MNLEFYTVKNSKVSLRNVVQEHWDSLYIDFFAKADAVVKQLNAVTGGHIEYKTAVAHVYYLFAFKIFLAH